MMMINCTNKGCFKFQSPTYDPKDDKVYCGECDKEIPNVTIFTKNQLKANKQIRKSDSKAYSLVCNWCKKEQKPVLNGNKVCCSLCAKELSLSYAFKLMLLEQLKVSSEVIFKDGK